MEVTMKVRMTLGLATMGVFMGCGPIEVALDGDGLDAVGGVGGAYSTGGGPADEGGRGGSPAVVGGAYSTGGGPEVGGAYAMGGESTGAVGGGYSVGGGPAVGGGYSVGGSGGYSNGGSGGAPGDECWTEEVGSANGCIDNDIFLGRAFERCDLLGASLSSISYTQICDGFTSSMVLVSCCPLSGSGGATGTGGTDATTGGATGTGGTDATTGGATGTGGTDATTGGATGTGGTDATTGGTGGTDATTGGTGGTDATTGGTDSGGWSGEPFAVGGSVGAGAADGYGAAEGSPR
jgi:hypothetical protein